MAPHEQVWDWGGNGYLQYEADNADAMGYVAENAVIQRCLLQQLEGDRGRVHLLWPVRRLHMPSLEHPNCLDITLDSAVCTSEKQGGTADAGQGPTGQRNCA